MYMNYLEKTFISVNYIVYFLYIATYLGLWNSAPEYLTYMKTILKTYIALVLIYFFNPLNGHVKVSAKFHNDVAFSAGIFLLTSLTLESVTDAIKHFTIDFLAK